jgi:hypothetical protein
LRMLVTCTTAPLSYRYQHNFSPSFRYLPQLFNLHPLGEETNMESANFIPLGSVMERSSFDRPDRPPKTLGATKGDSIALLAWHVSQVTDLSHRGTQDNCP